MSQGDLFAPRVPTAATRMDDPPATPHYALRRLHPWERGKVLETAYAMTPFDAWMIARDWRAEKAVLVLEVIAPDAEKLDMADILGPFRRPEFRGIA